MFQRILVAIDGSPVASHAVDVAVQLGEQLGARMAVLHVVDDSRAYALELAVLDSRLLTGLRRDGVAFLDAACKRIPAETKVERLLLEGDPSELIVSAARDWHADVIVIGNDSRGRLAHFLLGSTADSVIRHGPCPVLTVRCNHEAGPNHSGPEKVSTRLRE